MNILDLIVGKAIKTSDERAEQIGIQQGIPIFGLDALSSAAYGPEAALSLQFGMAVHWRKNRGPHWIKSALVNGLGGFVTAITVLVVLVAKFVEGAWITVIFIPLLIFFFRVVRRHYHMVSVATSCASAVVPADQDARPLVVVPVEHWSQVSKQALEFASRLSPEITAVHVEPGDHSEFLHMEWERYVEQPFRAAGLEPPNLVILPSPYRFIIVPIVQYVLELSAKNPDRKIVVVIPELVEDHWYEYFLHNQRARLFEWTLLVRGNKRIYTVGSPFYVMGQSAK